MSSEAWELVQLYRKLSATEQERLALAAIAAETLAPQERAMVAASGRDSIRSGGAS